MPSSVTGASSLPARQSRFLADAPGTTVQLTGVIDGHGLWNTWLSIGTAPAEPATYGDFASTGYDGQLVEVEAISGRTGGGLLHFSATVPDVAVGGSTGDQVWAMLISHQPLDPPPGPSTVPYVVGRLGTVGAPS